jgi:hypothetical protein
MSFSWTRVKAIIVKELNDYRRNRFVMVFTMTILPLIFIIAPTVELLALPAQAASSRLDTRVGVALLYMLLIPAIVPSTVSAYSVIGEREQGTLEPILITPIRPEGFLIGKALAVVMPTPVVAYAIFGAFLAIAALFAHPGIESAIFAGSHIPVSGSFHAVARGLVDLGRDRDLRSLLGRPRRPAAQRVRQPAPGRDRRADGVQRDPALDRTGARPRRRPAHARRARLARGGGDVRPRVADHRSAKLTRIPMVVATLTVKRESVMLELRGAPFQITLDGTTVGTIDRHETFRDTDRAGTPPARSPGGPLLERSRSI